MASESNSFKTFVSLIASVTLHLAAIIIVALYANSHRPEPKAKVIMIATDLPMGNPQGPTHLTPGAKGSPGKVKPEKTTIDNQKQNSKNLETKTQESKKSEKPKKLSQEQKKAKASNKSAKTEKATSSKQKQKNSSSAKNNSKLKDPHSKKEKTTTDNQKQNKEENSQQSGQDSQQKELSAEEKARQEALANISNEIANRNNSSTNTSSAGGNDSKNISGEGGAGGGGGPGSEVGARDSSYINYIVKVKNLIQRNWVRLGAESGKVLKAQINIKVDANGNVTSKVMIRGSGSTSFDHSIKRAIESSTPLPPPPASIRQDAMTDGIIIDFTGGARSG